MKKSFKRPSRRGITRQVGFHAKNKGDFHAKVLSGLFVFQNRTPEVVSPRPSWGAGSVGVWLWGVPAGRPATPQAPLLREQRLPGARRGGRGPAPQAGTARRPPTPGPRRPVRIPADPVEGCSGPAAGRPAAGRPKTRPPGPAAGKLVEGGARYQTFSTAERLPAPRPPARPRQSGAGTPAGRSARPRGRPAAAAGRTAAPGGGGGSPAPRTAAPGHGTYLLPAAAAPAQPRSANGPARAPRGRGTACARARARARARPPLAGRLGNNGPSLRPGSRRGRGGGGLKGARARARPASRGRRQANGGGAGREL